MLNYRQNLSEASSSIKNDAHVLALYFFLILACSCCRTKGIRSDMWLGRRHTCHGSVHLGMRSVSTAVKRDMCGTSATVDLLRRERGARDTKQYSSWKLILACSCCRTKGIRSDMWLGRRHTCHGSVHLGMRSVSTAVKRDMCGTSATVDLLRRERGARDTKQYSSWKQKWLKSRQESMRSTNCANCRVRN